MALIVLLVKRLSLISIASILLVVAIYWFELDDKFLRSLEPTFRKLAGWIKKM